MRRTPSSGNYWGFVFGVLVKVSPHSLLIALYHTQSPISSIPQFIILFAPVARLFQINTDTAAATAIAPSHSVRKYPAVSPVIPPNSL